MTRLGGGAGIGFAAAFMASLVLTDLPDESSSTAEAMRFYADDGNRTHALLAGYLAGVAALLFVGFLVAVVALLRAADPRSPAATAAVVAGSAYFALYLAAAASFMAPAATLALDPESGGRVTPELADFARGLSMLGDWLLLVFSMLAAAVLVLATSLGALRSRLLPRWLARGGLLVAASLLAGAAFFPALLFLLWAIAVSVVLLRVREGEARAADVGLQ
jgi:hypothetical protein